ncbi:Tn3 family transposase [Streptomyces sp. NPDC000151]|uniref:Tn3 family transposase n=1 Tax=Streptomyces sp. NPDC000151 TaxID=3154244 RepID=UPI0033348F09
MANRHFSIALLNGAVADLVNAYARLDISQAWGDGTAVAADGTHMDTYLNNLLAETSVRYGKAGGIAYHHISDTYIALFTHFNPCGFCISVARMLLTGSSCSMAMVSRSRWSRDSCGSWPLATALRTRSCRTRTTSATCGDSSASGV